MCPDEIPIDCICEQRIDMFEATALVRPVQRQIFPIPDARHQLDTEQVGQREYGRVLSLCVGMERVRLNFTLVFEQAIKNVDGFPDATWDEVAEQRDVAIGDVIVADAAVPSVADVVLGQQILFIQIPFRTVGRSALAGTPQSWDRELVIGVNNSGDRLVHFVFRDVALIYPGNLPSISGFKGPGGLARPQVAAVTKAGYQVSFPGSIQLGVVAR